MKVTLKISIALVFLFVIAGVYSCKKKKKEEVEFNRAELLTNVTSTQIVPGYTDLNQKVGSLSASITSFTSAPSATTLADAQSTFKQAYLAWVTTTLYSFGPSADNLLSENINSFPCDTSVIKSNIASGTYDLSALSNLTAKGFPALDFLLFGRNLDASALVALYTTDPNAANRKTYLINITSNLSNAVSLVKNSWNVSYQTMFTSNAGTDLGSSVSLIVNGLSKELENTRRARVGNPLGYVGLVSSGITVPGSAECFYGNYSKELLVANLQSAKKLFNGGSGLGFDDYLNAVNAQYDNGNPLSVEINAQFDRTIAAAQKLSPDLTTALVNSNADVEKLFLEVKKLVVLIKLDMASQLGIVISYADNDGD